MIGQNFADFTILDTLGEGGMGKVYLALQRSLEREVALKVIAIDSSISNDVLERFIREARIAASIEHPNIVSIYSVGREQNFLFIAMEYIQGMSLEEQITRGGLSEFVIWRIALQVCQALQCALQKGVIHRDIKPANILLAGPNNAKLTDFGISKRMNEKSALTQAGMILGTPHYMSPEQSNAMPVDFRSDIYSLGATIYRALTGQLLFSGDTVVDVIIKQRNQSVIPPEEYNPGLKPASSIILGKMLHKLPDARYASYGDLMADIQALLHDEPLFFATEAQLSEIYTQMPTRSKRFTKRAKVKAPANQRRLVLVTGEFSLKLLQNCRQRGYEVHLASSLTELRIHLKQPAMVILDVEYAGPQIVDYCNILKEDYAAMPVFFMLDKTAQQLPPNISKALLPVPYGSDLARLAELLPTHIPNHRFLAGQIDLRLTIELARQGSFTTTRVRFQGKEGDGVITVRRGKIVEARQNQLRGELALRAMLGSEGSWTLEHPTNTGHARLAADPTHNLSSPTNTAQPSSASYNSGVCSITSAATLPVSQHYGTTAQGGSQKMSGLMGGTTPLINQGAVEYTPTGSSAALPATQPPSEYHPQASNTAPPQLNAGQIPFMNVMIVNEEVEQANALTAYLNNSGHIMALCTQTTEDALALLNMDNFQVVISKIGQFLPGGHPFQEELYRLYPQMYQIILANGYTPEHILQSLTEVPRVVFLENPKDFSVILNTIIRWQHQDSENTRSNFTLI